MPFFTLFFFCIFKKHLPKQNCYSKVLKLTKVECAIREINFVPVLKTFNHKSDHKLWSPTLITIFDIDNQYGGQHIEHPFFHVLQTTEHILKKRSHVFLHLIILNIVSFFPHPGVENLISFVGNKFPLPSLDYYQLDIIWSNIFLLWPIQSGVLIIITPIAITIKKSFLALF